MRTLRLTAALVAAMSAASFAAQADYSVQIGAYLKPDMADWSSAAQVAQVRTHKGPSGLTRVLVGRFDSSAQAQSALQSLRTSGYRDAFVTRLPTHAVHIDASPKVSQVSSKRNLSNEAPDAKWNHLSRDIRSKLVILDGRPHIKEGESFIPLEEYPVK